MTFRSQAGCAYRFDWGREGLDSLARECAVVVIVDVLRFTTAVCCALEAGATVFPFPWNDPRAAGHAEACDAVLAGRRERGELSLSPTDLRELRPGTRLVLPSPNGSALSFAAAELGVRHVLAGCLRNATATARAALHLAEGAPIAVIAAGERWPHDALRPAVEDMIGAGAVLAALDPAAAVSPPRCSPEAVAARAAFVAARPLLRDVLHDCASGRELVERGWADDVGTAAAHDASAIVARLDPTEPRAYRAIHDG